MRAREVVLAGYAADSTIDLDAALHDDDPAVRVRAVGALARRGRRSVAQRLAALTDRDAIVRLRGCELEARAPRKSVQVLAALVRCLDDADPLVVVAACDALGELADGAAPSAINPLGAVAKGHDDARCREAAVAALGGIGDPSGVAFVLDALTDKPAVRRRAVVALSAFEGPRVEEALAGALTDRDWQVRQAAEALRDATT